MDRHIYAYMCLHLHASRWYAAHNITSARSPVQEITPISKRLGILYKIGKLGCGFPENSRPTGEVLVSAHVELHKLTH